ncbi:MULTISPECIES: DUF4175 family protein [unclassified Duganella]|uniref:DUF4175 family protein n=1 Tax=unclassified Duganella TaxID=2636909 RepID=UPI00088E96B1|nr:MULTISPECIES: DUF4175 family protein [unclassified Duganella]SDH59834.1 protein of unknown function [Duganella sp. OV458]SDJ43341.1 protein of unknown function [Duganella sp. OV510]
MPGATDHLRGRLWSAILRRRAPQWLAALLPLLIAAVAWPAARTPALIAIATWAAWTIADALRWRHRIAEQWPSWLNAAIPQLEDSSTLLAAEAHTPIARLQQQRLQARLADILTDTDYQAIARTRVRFAILPMVISLLAAGAAWGWQGQPAAKPAPPAAAQANKPIVDGEVYLRVTPPQYTGVAAFDTGARDIQIPQYSEVRWCVRNATGAQPAVELGDGKVLPITDECAKLRVEDSLFWRARGKNTARYNIRVTLDQAPQVTIIEPVELIHLLQKDARTVTLSVSAKDDYAIVRASLHMTLARGSGENIRFSDKEVPLPQSSDPKSRGWKKQWTLAELGMEPGDELYFFVRATDNAPENPHTAQSPTYTLRLPGPDAESLDSTALPSMTKPENLRSQRQIIIDTEQLVADLKANPNMPAATLRSRSEGIAADQATLRLRYGQFLGEESTLFGDEQHEHHDHGNEKPGSEIGVMKEFGHAHDQEDNATIFDPQTKAVLKRALAAMWDAEKSLRAVAPKNALPPEYKALEAIKELQAAERVYLHRTAFVPPALKEEKRMSGDIVGAMSYKRAQGAASDTVPAEVRDLVQALSQDGALPALWSKAAREVIGARINDQEQKLSAQRAVQDVQDGCVPCRAELRAWLRGTLADAPVLLQARPAADTGFRQAWKGKEQAK